MGTNGRTDRKIQRYGSTGRANQRMREHGFQHRLSPCRKSIISIVPRVVSHRDSLRHHDDMWVSFKSFKPTNTRTRERGRENPTRVALQMGGVYQCETEPRVLWVLPTWLLGVNSEAPWCCLWCPAVCSVPLHSPQPSGRSAGMN